MASLSGSHRKAWWSLLAGVGLSLATTQPGACEEARPPLISVAVPDGFADLDAAQPLIVDIYVNGVRVGQTEIMAEPGAFRFDSPAEVAAMMPGLRASPHLLQRLGGSIAANEGLVCGEGSDRLRCGRLVPEDVGAILNRDRFRLDLFFGPEFGAAHFEQLDPYLAPPDGALSLVNAIAGVASGSTGGSASLSLQDRLILASGNKRLRSDLYYSREYGFQADQAFAEIDVDEWRYSAGLMFVPGSDLIGRRKLLGAGLASQLDTRIDRETLLGSPLPVSLASRGRVEIVRNGRVLASQVLEPGNHRLDTASLPEGSYEITIRVAEIGAPIRETTQFYTKSARVAPVGRDLIFVYGGLLAREDTRSILRLTDRAYALAGYAHRWNSHFATDATLVATDKSLVAQVGGNVFVGDAQLRVAGLGSASGAYGALVQFGLHGQGPLGIAVDLRKVELRGNATIDGLASQELRRENSLADDIAALRAGDRSFTQLTGFVGYGRFDRQFGFSVSARKQEGERLTYSLGPTLRWDVMQRGPLRVSFNADGGLSERGHSGFVGLSLNLAGPRGSTSSRAGLRYANFDGEARRLTPVATLTGATQFDGVAGGALQLGAGLESDADRRILNLSGRLETERVSLSSDVLQDLGGEAQYSVGLRSTVTATRGKVALRSQDQSQAGVMVKVSGGRRNDQYEILVDDAVVATLADGSTHSLSLAPYKEYRVRIRPLGWKALAYTSQERKVSLAPGSVVNLEWATRPLATIFGRLVWPGGEAARFALIAADGAIGETDANGYFQIEAAAGAELTARFASGETCSAALPPASSDNAFAMVGALVCTPDPLAGTTIAARRSGDDND